MRTTVVRLREMSITPQGRVIPASRRNLPSGVRNSADRKLPYLPCSAYLANHMVHNVTAYSDLMFVEQSFCIAEIRVGYSSCRLLTVLLSGHEPVIRTTFRAAGRTRYPVRPPGNRWGENLVGDG